MPLSTFQTHFISLMGFRSLHQLFLSAGADPNGTSSSPARRPLHCCETPEAAQLLLEFTHEPEALGRCMEMAFGECTDPANHVALFRAVDCIGLVLKHQRGDINRLVRVFAKHGATRPNSVVVNPDIIQLDKDCLEW